MRNLMGSAALMFASILLAMLAAEGVLRVFPDMLPELARLHVHWAAGTGDEYPPAPHRYIGFVPQPAGVPLGADATDASAQAIWGNRNRPPWPQRAEIVVLGDSFVYSQMVSADRAWTSQLDDALPGLRVMALGTIGTGPPQYLRVYETYGRQLSPKLVLVGLFMRNDPTDAENFDRWWRDAREEDYRYFRSGEQQTGPAAWLRQLRQKSYLAAMVNHLRRSLLGDTSLEGETIVLESGEPLQLVTGALVRSGLDVAPGQRGFDLAIESVARLNEIAASDGSACLVLLFPSKEEIYGQFTGHELPDIAAPTIAALQQRGIEYLDLGPVFRERARERSGALFLEVDGHPTARGYALIAETVHAYLRQNAARYGLDLEGLERTLAPQTEDERRP